MPQRPLPHRANDPGSEDLWPSRQAACDVIVTLIGPDERGDIMDVHAANAKLPPTDNPKFDRVHGIWARGDDEVGYRKAAADAGFSRDDIERGQIIRYWQPLHSAKEAFIYHHWDLFDGAANLIAHETEAEDTGSEPD